MHRLVGGFARLVPLVLAALSISCATVPPGGVHAPLPRSRDELLAVIGQNLTSRNLDSAESGCRELLRRNPADPEAEMWLGQVESARGRFDAALAHYQVFRERKPDDFYPYNRLGWGYYNLGDYTNSIEAFQKANTFKGDYGTDLGLGLSFLELGDHAAAEKALLRAEQANPADTDVLLALGQVYREQGHYDQALAAYRRVNTLASHGWQADILTRIGQLDEARGILLQMLEQVAAEVADPSRPTAARRVSQEWLSSIRMRLATVELYAGNVKKAAEHLQGRPFFGFEMKDTDDGRLQIGNVTPHSPAARAGIRKDDVLVEMADHVVTNGVAQFSAEIFPSLRFGAPTPFVLRRQGRTLKLSIVAGLQPGGGTEAREAGGEPEMDLPERTWERESIAVAPFDPLGLSEKEVQTLTENFRGALVDTEYFDVVSRADMDRILSEAQFQRSEQCSETECLVEMGRILSVNRIIGGSIGKVGRAYNVTARMVDVETSRIECSATEDVRTEAEDLLPTVRRVARRLALKHGASRSK